MFVHQAERRNQIQNGAAEDDDVPENELTEVKDLRSNKKKENKEKQNKKKANEVKSHNFLCFFFYHNRIL